MDEINLEDIILFILSIIISQSVHIGVQQDYDEGVEEVEQKPHVHHLHVRGLGEVITHVDEHSRQDQHGGEVYSYHSLDSKKYKRILKLIPTLLKEKLFEIIC